MISHSTSWLIPPGTLPEARLLLAARGLRAFGDGFVALLLPYYLILLGLDALEVGVIVTVTLLGAGTMTLAAGLIAHRFRSRTLLVAASLLLVAAGIAMASVSEFWPLLVIAALGIINP